ncbi:hypothetical protein QQS21_010421 [Conoideocrella luteorostrata]|uniref:Uncharacterized protein n=1 Tax=Conoideocrella luteorostrata TaxID=1105319 RepID=A0AAJ0FPF9_9HYPO|nr:hypothetical protein QQS21_010421 [Conoideocrella luteorostrata]
MEETWLSILCGQPWLWDSDGANQISFAEDGTGDLICRPELNVWIAAEFDWKSCDGKLSQTIDITRTNNKTIQAQIELTLTKRRIPRIGAAKMAEDTINESLLKDSAFQPKSYTLALENDIFLSQFDSINARHLPSHTPRFGFRLVFDKSPYPPRDEWKEPGGAQEALKFWEWTEFCARQIGCF